MSTYNFILIGSPEVLLFVVKNTDSPPRSPWILFHLFCILCSPGLGMLLPPIVRTCFSQDFPQANVACFAELQMPQNLHSPSFLHPLSNDKQMQKYESPDPLGRANSKA